MSAGDSLEFDPMAPFRKDEEFDPSDFERPRGGLVRGSFVLPAWSISVLISENENGESVASVHAWETGMAGALSQSRSEVFKAPTRKEAWAALAQWVATAFAALLIFSGCGGPDVSCAGPLPVSCECATSCDFSADAGAVVPDFSQVASGQCLPRCWRRDTGRPFP